MSEQAGAPLMLSVSGCRGVTGRSLTPDVASRFAGAFAAFLRDERGAHTPSVVFGRDGRAGAHALCAGAIDGLRRAGCNVTDLGVAATPTVGVMTDHLGAHAGMVLTASHNPGEWNGLKCLVTGPAPLGAHAPNAAEAQRIIDRFRAAAPPASAVVAGRLDTRADGAKIHVDRVLGAVARLVPLDDIRARRFHVAVDSVNASGAEAARLICNALGCRLTHLYADTSGVFPHQPEPTRENLRDLCEQVRALRADAGFAQDPDADRLAILDERADYIGEEYTLVFAAMAVGGSAGQAPVFATNLSTSRMLDDAAAAVGGRVARSAVGEANVVDAMRRERSPLGGEGNGGVIWPEVVWIRDSIAAIALTLALMTRERKTLSQLVAAAPAYVIEKRKAPVREGLAARAADALAAHFSAVAGARIDRQDGVRIDLGQGPASTWVHVRASNTEPIMRLIAEAPDRARADALLDETERVIAGLA